MAVWAPNYHLTQPWEFVVVTGETKRRLAEVRRKAVLAKLAGRGPEKAAEQAERKYQEMVNVPAVIVVSMEPAEDPVTRQEDYAATACAIQNLMLAAWAQGIGTYWGTGPLLKHPETFSTLGIDPSRQIVGILFAGYPAAIPEVKRIPVEKKSRWLD